jgi:hypothetical protein
VDETGLARLELDEGSVGCDPNDGARDNRPDLGTHAGDQRSFQMKNRAEVCSARFPS